MVAWARVLMKVIERYREMWILLQKGRINRTWWLIWIWGMMESRVNSDSLVLIWVAGWTGILLTKMGNVGRWGMEVLISPQNSRYQHVRNSPSFNNCSPPKIAPQLSQADEYPKWISPGLKEVLLPLSSKVALHGDNPSEGEEIIKRVWEARSIEDTCICTEGKMFLKPCLWKHKISLLFFILKLGFYLGANWENPGS